MEQIWIPQAIVCLMLLWALNPNNPYGYYTLLRWICCGIFVFLTFQAQAIHLGPKGLARGLGSTALIYNPIFPIHLTRPI